MSTQITNQARLTFRYGPNTGSAVSNVASTTLQGPMTIEKNALTDRYEGQDEITYLISFTNTTCAAMSDVTVTDDLGTYRVRESLETATPLTFEGPAALYVNGSFVSHLDGGVCPSGVSFNVGSLGGGDSALIIYKARVNDYFLPSARENITNTATVSAEGLSEAATASHVLDVGRFADVSIVKTMTPDPVTRGDLITYNFAIYNYGNTPAEGVVLTDEFSPAPEIRSVEINGNAASPADYRYTDGNLTLPTGRMRICVPAACFSQDCTGLVTKIPGLTTVTVTGTVF